MSAPAPVDPVEVIVDEFSTLLAGYQDVAVKALAVGVGLLVLRKGWREFKHLVAGDGVRLVRGGGDEWAKDRAQLRGMGIK